MFFWECLLLFLFFFVRAKGDNFQLLFTCIVLELPLVDFCLYPLQDIETLTGKVVLDFSWIGI